MNNDSSTQWPDWQLRPNEQQLWTLLLLLLFLSFVLLGLHVPMFQWYEDWVHRRTAGQPDRDQQQTSDQLERNGHCQTVAPYPQTYVHESSGTIGRDRLAGVRVGHAQMDADNDTRISGVRRPPQGNPSTLVNANRNSNQQRRIEVLTIDRWGSTAESDARTDCLDPSEYEVHAGNMESGSSNPVLVPAPSVSTSAVALSTSTPAAVVLAPALAPAPLISTSTAPVGTNSWSNFDEDELDWGTDDDD